MNKDTPAAPEMAAPEQKEVKAKLKASRMMLILTVLSLAIAGSAFLFASPSEIWQGFKAILTSPSPLLTDYLELGGIGAAFFNAGLMALLSVLIVYRSGAQPNGAVLAAVFTLAGFSFFGKNLFNSLPITAGVFLYSRFTGTPFRRQILVGLFGTTLGPLVSLLMFGIGLPPGIAVPLGLVTGIVTGFILPPLAAAFIRFHQGYSLYNIGFTGGMVGLVAIGFLGYLGVPLAGNTLLFSGDHGPFAWWLGVFFFLLTLFGLLTHRRLVGMTDETIEAVRPGGLFARYRLLLANPGRLVADFATQYGVGVTFFNMGLTGLLVLIYVLAVGAHLNGPVLGGLFTVCGFAAFGKHPRNITPIIAGVFLMNLLTGRPNCSTAAVLAALFGTTLAPLAGQFGALAGIAAGMTHMAIVANVGMLHAGVNLYNNGFAGGFVAAFYVPLLELLEQKGLLFRPLARRNEASDKASVTEDELST